MFKLIAFLTILFVILALKNHENIKLQESNIQNNAPLEAQFSARPMLVFENLRGDNVLL